MRKNRKKNINGFTLIEILISMAIFGFLLYVISDILFTTINNIVQAQQESYLRGSMENIINNISKDIQFATTVAPCRNNVSGCISLAANIEGPNGSIIPESESIYYDPTLHTIIKSVTINGNTVLTDLNRYSSTNSQYKGTVDIVTGPVFDITGSNVLFTFGGVVRGSNQKIIGKELQLGASVQFGN